MRHSIFRIATISSAMILFSISYAYCQKSMNPTGDGIVQRVKQEARKLGAPRTPSTYFQDYISDFPILSMRFERFGIGISYEDSGGHSQHIEVSSATEEDAKSLVEKKNYDNQDISLKVTADAQAKFSTGPSMFSGSLSIDTNASYSSGRGFTRTADQTQTYDDQKKKLEKDVYDKKATFDKNSGFAYATLVIHNPDLRKSVYISTVTIHLTPFDLKTGIPSNIAGYKDVVVRLGALDEAGLTVAGEERVVIAPNKTVEESFRIDNINTDEISNMIDNGQSIAFDLRVYSLAIANPLKAGAFFSFEDHRDDINNNCFVLRIIDDDEDISYNVAKYRFDNGSRLPMTIRQALEILYPDASALKTGVLVSTHQRYLSRLGKFVSSPQLLSDVFLSGANKNEGLWFCSANFDFKDLDSPVREANGVSPEVIVEYVRAVDLLSQGILYIGNSHSITTFSIGPQGTMGHLTQYPLRDAGSGATQMVSNPKGSFVFGWNAGPESNKVSSFRVDPFGSLQEVPSDVQVTDIPQRGAVSPDGSFLFIPHEIVAGYVSPIKIGADGKLQAYSAQPVASGWRPIAVTAVTKIGEDFLYVTDWGDGLNYAISHFDLAWFGINGDGTLKSLGSVSTETNPFGVVATHNGDFLYVANYYPRDLHPANQRVDPGWSISGYEIGIDGSLKPLPSGYYDAAPAPTDLIVSPDDSYLYVVCSNSILKFPIKPNGELDKPTTFPTTLNDSVGKFAITPSGRYLCAPFASGVVEVFKIDPNSGDLKLVDTKATGDIGSGSAIVLTPQ